MSPRAAIRIVSFLSVILGSAVSVPAAKLKEGKGAGVVTDVQLLPTGAAARPATVNDDVRDGIAVRTGVPIFSEPTDIGGGRLSADTTLQLHAPAARRIKLLTFSFTSVCD